ncbi:regulation of nuclear pre-mRNA domain-containing protein 2 [Melanotaenia boesemani]|uniref:regulation of nuclear pre-mRNA domain-containing protein 2 n=1 Tax=Melanotaenia boesemani TaxID=1250792 RepID=UPI001C048F62|nr:regulation of nuclear pre-mRNA domain-containing protein 2 [Melanotaenia boesemani]
MAAGSGAASGQGARSSTAGLEASLDRRLQGVSNTMESIQGLSSWCIENKKHHGLVVRHWMKWLKKSDNNHRLNLFYLANDVIQNCKRKNAVVFRSAFSEVLPNAAQLIKDGKVRKSVERIFTIWEERSIYPEEVIAQFKANLNKKEKEREKQKEKEKEKEKLKETPPANATTSTKADLKSKIVAEFTPQSLIEQLSKYKRAVAEEEFREKQLAALRVDVCSTEALKRLKDKAGGNKFAKDFEDGSLKLQEFVSFLEKELKTGPPLMDVLGNADIFYETQYKEVKIVANAYNAFANRVTSLKRKLDSLKSTLPGPEDSPLPSPSEDAPSPTGSDSPFLGLDVGRAQVDPELDGKAMDEGETQSDNRDMEDMDMSDEEANNAAVEDNKKDKPSSAVAKISKSEAPAKLPNTPTSKTSASATVAPMTPTSAKATTAPTNPLGVNLAKVDLGKISSILSSLTSAMKNTANPSPRPSPGTPTTPTGQSAASKATPPSPALASILSRVDITPEGILSALSKTSTPAFSSLLQNVTNTSSAPSTRTSPESASGKTLVSPTTPKTKPALGNSLKRETPGRTRDWEEIRQSPPPPPPRPVAPSVSPPSLESKINSFLQGNPGFSLALGDVSPDGVDGTPVRDEAAGTPTQDEIMDTPGSMPESLGSSGGHNLSPTAYRSDPWDAAITPSGSDNDGNFLGSSSSRYGAGKKSSTKLKDNEAMRKQISSSTGNDMKGKKDERHSQPRIMGNSRVMGERKLSAGSRKASSGSDDGNLSGKKVDKGKVSTGGEGEEGQYHRIETLVSPHTEGAPIQTLGYSNRPLAGERIKTVESIRVIGRGSRRGGGAGSRPGVSVWYEEEEYREAQPPTPQIIPPPLNISQGGAEDMNPPMPPPLPRLPPPPHLLIPHLHPPPPLSLPPPLPQPPFQMPYHAENIQTPPPLHLQHPPTSPFFSTPPPIPRPPPPPAPQRLSPPPTHPSVPSAVMVGGVLVPVDRPLTLPPPIRGEVGDHCGMGPRGSKVTPPPLMSSLLGEPPKLPRPGTVKEPFVPRHTPPLHRPGTPGVPPPLLGRVKEPLNLPLPSPSPSPTSSTPSPSTPNSPAVDSHLPQKPPASPPAQPRNQTSNPVPLLNLPSPRPPILSTPVSQRPLQRGRTPSQDLSRVGFRGGKRAGPPFPGSPFNAQKRPFLPPRY